MCKQSWRTARIVLRSWKALLSVCDILCRFIPGSYERLLSGKSVAETLSPPAVDAEDCYDGPPQLQ